MVGLCLFVGSPCGLFRRNLSGVVKQEIRADAGLGVHEPPPNDSWRRKGAMRVLCFPVVVSH